MLCSMESAIWHPRDEIRCVKKIPYFMNHVKVEQNKTECFQVLTKEYEE